MVIIQMKATDQYCTVVLFTILYTVIQTFESVDEILNGVTIQMKATLATEQYFSANEVFCFPSPFLARAKVG